MNEQVSEQISEQAEASQEVSQEISQETIPVEVSQEAPPTEVAQEAPVATPDPERQKEVQEILNKMVWKHGGNLHKRQDFLDILKAGGLQRSDINKAMLRQAERTARKRAKEESEKKWSPEDNQKLNWMPEPDVETWSVGMRVHIWETKCGRYRVFRFSTPGGPEFAAQWRTPEATWDIFENDKDGPGYPKYVTSLETALLAVERFHEKRTGITILHSNRQEVLEEEKKIFPTPKAEEQTTATTSTAKPHPTSRGTKNPGMEEKILAVLDPVVAKGPKQIKIDAGIALDIGINSLMKKLGRENKVIVGYGAYKLHPSMVKPSTPKPEEKKEKENE